MLKEAVIILKNMGYQTDLVDSNIGLIMETKQVQEKGAAAIVMTILSIGLASVDNDTTFMATFVARPSLRDQNSFFTRLTLQRIVFNSSNEATSVELIEDNDIYKIFYERLEASLFTEPDRI